MLTFRDAAADLEAAVQALGYTPDPADEVWEESATQYLRFLSATLVGADGRFAREEFHSLAEHHDDGANYHEEAELTRGFTRRAMLTRPPRFLADAWSTDPSVACRIRDAIHHVVMALVTVDGGVAAEERSIARAYLRLDGLTGGPYSKLMEQS